MDISIVICTFNRETMLCDALESLISQETDGEFTYEIVVVDNASTVDIKPVVDEMRTKSAVPVRYMFEEKKGIAPARNRGVKESYGEWIAFCDDDEIAQPDWLKNLYLYVVETGAQIVGGSVKLLLSPDKLSHLSPIIRRILGEIGGRNHPEKCGRKTYPGTGNVLLHRSMCDSIEWFDESLQWGGVDLDYFRKARMAGFEAWYTPTAVVYHTIPAYRLQEKYLIWRSLLNGSNFACRDYREWGMIKTVFSCVGRIGQALLVNLPLLFWAYILGKDAEILGRKCLLWRAVGYIKHCLFLLAPRIFKQEMFFTGLEFRKEREIFPKH